jgi:hypothetical protein
VFIQNLERYRSYEACHNNRRGDVIPEKPAMKIFGAADRILNAGQS